MGFLDKLKAGWHRFTSKVSHVWHHHIKPIGKFIWRGAHAVARVAGALGFTPAKAIDTGMTGLEGLADVGQNMYHGLKSGNWGQAIESGAQLYQQAMPMYQKYIQQQMPQMEYQSAMYGPTGSIARKQLQNRDIQRHTVQGMAIQQRTPPVAPTAPTQPPPPNQRVYATGLLPHGSKVTGGKLILPKGMTHEEFRKRLYVKPPSGPPRKVPSGIFTNVPPSSKPQKRKIPGSYYPYPKSKKRRTGPPPPSYPTNI